MEAPILVTGAMGNVGTEVVKALLDKGKVIRAADINENRTRERFGEAVEPVRFDFTNPETYEKTFAGVEQMFLMRPPHLSNIKRDMVPAMNAAKRAGIRHVVFLSVIGIENMKFIPHSKVESHLTQQGIQVTFLRCSFFMQNLSTTHRQEIKERNEIFVPVGKARTSFIDVRDIGAVAAKILTESSQAGKKYDLTGAETLDYWQIAQILSETLGRKIQYSNPNAVKFFIETVLRGAPLSYALVVMGLYTTTRYGMADVVTNHVERLLGRKPIAFRQFTEDYKDAWL